MAWFHLRAGELEAFDQEGVYAQASLLRGDD